MVKVTVNAALVVFVNVPLISPLPLDAIPVTDPVLFLVQLKVVGFTLPVRAIVEMAFPEHIVCDAGVATALGVGLTVNITVPVPYVQPPAVTFIVMGKVPAVVAV